jgi:hypothetical protein
MGAFALPFAIWQKMQLAVSKASLMWMAHVGEVRAHDYDISLNAQEL